jgi:hypothetical protein
MTIPQEMFQTQKNGKSSSIRQNHLSRIKRKRIAVLSKPRKGKPGAVDLLLNGVGLNDHAYFISEKRKAPSSA